MYVRRRDDTIIRPRSHYVTNVQCTRGAEQSCKKIVFTLMMKQTYTSVVKLRSNPGVLTFLPFAVQIERMLFACSRRRCNEYVHTPSVRAWMYVHAAVALFSRGETRQLKLD